MSKGFPILTVAFAAAFMPDAATRIELYGGPRPIFTDHVRPANMDEAGDLFLGADADRLAKPAVIGAPFGEPGGDIAHRIGGDDEIRAGGAGRLHASDRARSA